MLWKSQKGLHLHAAEIVHYSTVSEATTEDSSLSALLDFLNLFIKKKKKKNFPFIFLSFPC